MYEYRKMTTAERARVLASRKLHLRPWHAPPHFEQTRGVYLISAACYEHPPVMATEARRTEWEAAVIDRLGREGPEDIEIRAWVVLPNHYHLLIEGDLRTFARRIAGLHNGTATQWNREDGTPGRRVWHRFSDRIIRSERHYYASLNYIHVNPVRHGYGRPLTIGPGAACLSTWTQSGVSVSWNGGGSIRLGTMEKAGTSSSPFVVCP